MTQFEELVIQNLGEIKESIADVQTKTTDLCERSAVTEEKIKNLEGNWKKHINTEIHAELTKNENKWKIPAIVFGGIASIATIISWFK